MSLPNAKKHFKHAGIGYCCNSRNASQEDMNRVETTGIAEIVNCTNCRGQFILEKTNHGLHVRSLSEND